MGDGTRFRGCFSFVLGFTELRVSTRLHQQTMLVKRLPFCFQTVCIWEQCLFSFRFLFCPDRGKRCTGGAVTGRVDSISGRGFFCPPKGIKSMQVDYCIFWRSADYQSGCRLRGSLPRSVHGAPQRSPPAVLKFCPPPNPRISTNSEMPYGQQQYTPLLFFPKPARARDRAQRRTVVCRKRCLQIAWLYQSNKSNE